MDWTLVVADAVTEPPFSAQTGEYTLQTPCATFAVRATVTDRGDCAACAVFVNGNQSEFTFTAATASDFPVQLCQGGCGAGPSLAYTFAVTTRLHVRWCNVADVRAEFSALQSLVTTPSRTLVPFAPALLAYSIYSGYPSASIAVTAPANVTVFINGNATTTLEQQLTIGAAVLASIQLQPAGYTCYSPFAYTVASAQSLRCTGGSPF